MSKKSLNVVKSKLTKKSIPKKQIIIIDLEEEEKKYDISDNENDNKDNNKEESPKQLVEILLSDEEACYSDEDQESQKEQNESQEFVVLDTYDQKVYTKQQVDDNEIEQVLEEAAQEVETYKKENDLIKYDDQLQQKQIELKKIDTIINKEKGKQLIIKFIERTKRPLPDECDEL